jgi:hypothetical protein
LTQKHQKLYFTCATAAVPRMPVGPFAAFEFEFAFRATSGMSPLSALSASDGVTGSDFKLFAASSSADTSGGGYSQLYALFNTLLTIPLLLFALLLPAAVMMWLLTLRWRCSSAVGLTAAAADCC